MTPIRKILLTITFVLAALVVAPKPAAAYPWMIRHEYVGCNSCHADPSGGSLLTAYGRGQGEILLRMPYGRGPEDDPGKVGNFLFGAVDLPEQLLLGGSVRTLLLRRMPSAGSAQNRFVLMQADLAGQITVSRFRANASIGYLPEGGLAAAVTRGPDHRLVSRTHWLGVDLGDENQVLVRAGRMNLPFGIRSIEHTAWVRAETRTDTNAAQQHGVAAAYNGDNVRGEIMGIAGNFQISPSRFRSIGYAGFAEYAFAPKLALGISSMITHAQKDLALLTPAWRHAHGLFGRYSPERWLVLTSEVDFLHTSQPTAGRTAAGAVGLLQADFMPVQGLHFGPTLEIANRAFATDRTSLGAWATAWWFFAPHADVRVDLIYQSLGAARASTGVTSLLAQLHVYL